MEGQIAWTQLKLTNKLLKSYGFSCVSWAEVTCGIRMIHDLCFINVLGLSGPSILSYLQVVLWFVPSFSSMFIKHMLCLYLYLTDS